MVEDLGSRNGLMINGVDTRGQHHLSHMDRIYIGAQELVLIDGAQGSRTPEAGTGVVCDACGAIAGTARRRCGECGALLGADLSPTCKDSQLRSHSWGAPEVTRTETTRDVIDGIAAKAVELGRYAEAERILLPHLDRLMDRALTGQPLSKSGNTSPESLVARATGNALELALGLSSDKWIDWVFRIHTATVQLMEAKSIETIRVLARSHEYARPAYVRAYVKALRRRNDWTDEEQMRIRMLEEVAEEIMARPAP